MLPASIPFRTSIHLIPDFDGMWMVRVQEPNGLKTVLFASDEKQAKAYYLRALAILLKSGLWKLLASGLDPVSTYTVVEWKGDMIKIFSDKE